MMNECIYLHRIECNMSKQLPATLAAACKYVHPCECKSKGFLGDIRPNDAHQNSFFPLVADEHNVRAKSAKGPV